MKCKVTSGEFEIIIFEDSLLAAANKAIMLHDRDQNREMLSDLTLVEELDGNELTGVHLFAPTRNLIYANTDGFGDNPGQYTSNSNTIPFPKIPRHPRLPKK